jgi:hypothetical protein
MSLLQIETLINTLPMAAMVIGLDDRVVASNEKVRVLQVETTSLH